MFQCLRSPSRSVALGFLAALACMPLSMTAAGAGNHRERDALRQRARAARDPRHPQSGNRAVDRRLRHRVLIARLAARVARARGEARQVVRHAPARTRRRSQYRQRDCAHGARAGLKVVAEGVESEWSARYLSDAGYDYGQGYRYSPALPAEECRRWIVSFNAAATADQLDQLAASG